MASSCCGTKKQKLNSSLDEKCDGPGPCTNGNVPKMPNSKVQRNGYGPDYRDHMDREKNPRMNGHVGQSPSRHSVVPYINGLGVSSGGYDKIATPEMCFYCFDVLYTNLHNTEPPRNPAFTNDSFPLFVTWKVGRDLRLRGCMGTFNALSLHSGLREYAITSAFKDSRFPPIGREELGKLHVSVSILRHFEDGVNYLDWEVGIHGIRIEFNTERGSRRTATYLPEVASEQGWNQTQTIDSLLRKGGFKGTVTPDIRTSIKLTRYRSEKVSVSYEEYINMWAYVGNRNY